MTGGIAIERSAQIMKRGINDLRLAFIGFRANLAPEHRVHFRIGKFLRQTIG